MNDRAHGPIDPPDTGPDAALAWVERHLAGLWTGPLTASPTIRGGQSAADAALAAHDVRGYASERNEVLPIERRGASGLSPWIRHGLLPLRRVWDDVEGGPARDVRKFRDELLWQEFARHWYARLGPRTQQGVRREPSDTRSAPTVDAAEAWDRSMRCVELTVGELERDGWLVNQTRMWLSSQWTVRNGWRWQEGEEEFFRHLLDGSRAANRLGWQWTTGVGSSKHYGFSRWQVRKRAPGTCDECVHADDCPIEGWPPDPSFVAVERPESVRRPASHSHVGPDEVVNRREPRAVWLTAESLGDDDPALVAHPDLPAVFVFDEPLLAALGLASKRLVFLAETLADLALRQPVEIHVGRPAEVLAGRDVAVTHAPVPGFAVRADAVDPAEIHPWPWLAPPSAGSVSSFSAWRRSVAEPS